MATSKKQLKDYTLDLEKKVNDRTKELKEKQQQLIQSEKMASIGQLAAGVAHEINNPTGFIMGNLEVLRDYKSSIKKVFSAYEKLSSHKFMDDTDANALLHDINSLKNDLDFDYILKDLDDLIDESLEGVHRIKKIVGELKGFSHVDDSDMKLVNVNDDVIEMAVRLVWNELKYKCKVHKNYGDLPDYLCFPGELSQVVMNLLINARDSIEKEGDITIGSKLHRGSLVISISDTGTGIKKENIPKLFEPFFTTKDINKGTGLGLSISHSIVEKHQGTLSVESELGKGTTFTICLPIKD